MTNVSDGANMKQQAILTGRYSTLCMNQVYPVLVILTYSGNVSALSFMLISLRTVWEISKSYTFG